MKSPKRSHQAQVSSGESPRVDFEAAYPNSKKIYVEGNHGIRVPMREISLTGGEPPVALYDTSGPQDINIREGLPALPHERAGALDAAGSQR